MTQLDRTINTIENILTTGTVVPVLGAVPGALKALMGAVQTVSASAIGLFIGVPARALGNKKILQHSLTHMKHGVGNMIGGSLEAIPFVGTASYGIRYLSKSNIGASDASSHIRTGHENKFMAYESLEAEDFYVAEGVQDIGGPALRTMISEIKANKTYKTAMEKYNAVRKQLGDDGWYQYRKFKTVK